MLASFLCTFTLNESGTGFPKFVEDIICGNEDCSSVHISLTPGAVLEAATSTILRNLARNCSLEQRASLISRGMSSEPESNSTVSSRSWSIASWPTLSSKLLLNV